MDNGRTKNRIYFLDYLRGFMVLLVVLDHSMHAYSQHYAKFWFFPDVDRSTFIDVLHLHNDAIMMPFLFFLAGMFVLPSLQRRGYLVFLKERFVRIVLPFIFGIFFISPFMVYHKHVIRDNLDQGFLDFWNNTYLRWQDVPFENVSQSGFWFLYLLFILTLGLLVIRAFFPRLLDGLANFARWCTNKPIQGFLTIGIVLAVILGLSDLTWGAPWWIGYKPVFHVRGSRFIAKMFFFLMGASFSHAGLMQDQKFLERLSQHWKVWVTLAAAILLAYITYTLCCFDTGAYSSSIPIRSFLNQGGTWDEVFGMLSQDAPMVLIRTTLLGLVMLSLTLMYLSTFRHFIDKPHKGWMSLAVCSYGIYIFHEPFVTGTHMALYGSPMDPILKFIVTSIISLTISWILVAQIFMKIPIFKRIL